MRRRLVHLIGLTIMLAIVGGFFLVDAQSTNRKPGSATALPLGLQCLRVIDLLPALFSGDIADEDLKKGIRFHLMRCGKCRQQYDEMRCCEKQSKTRPYRRVTLKPGSIDKPLP